MKVMKPVLEGIEAFLFDLDGTLVETNIDFPLMRREMMSLAERFSVDLEAVRSLDILSIITYIEEMLCARNLDDQARDARAEALRILEEIELTHSATATEMADAQRLIDLLRSRGVKVGIVTRNCRRASEASLRVAGMDVDVPMLAREDVPKTKPHPDHLLAALEQLQVDSSRSLIVGDHLMDVTAGKAAGMRTIGLLPPNRPRDFFDEVAPDAVIDHLREIIDAFVDLHS